MFVRSTFFHPSFSPPQITISLHQLRNHLLLSLHPLVTFDFKRNVFVNMSQCEQRSSDDYVKGCDVRGEMQARTCSIERFVVGEFADSSERQRRQREDGNETFPVSSSHAIPFFFFSFLKQPRGIFAQRSRNFEFPPSKILYLFKGSR